MSDEALSNAFNVETIEVITQDGKSTTIVPDGDEDSDHSYARTQTYNLIAKGGDALDIAMRVARESENPKAIEALATLMKNLAEINKTLVVLNKDRAEAKAARIGKGGTSVGTAVQHQSNIFVGSSKELNKMISEHLGKENAK